jgi:hypothetical protein
VNAAPEAVLASVPGVGPVDEPLAVQQDELGVVAERGEEPADQKFAAQDVAVVGVDRLDQVEPLGRLG